eukprot:1264107-Pleurochrysis_carterae.AAC.1
MRRKALSSHREGCSVERRANSCSAAATQRESVLPQTAKRMRLVSETRRKARIECLSRWSKSGMFRCKVGRPFGRACGGALR